MDFKRYIFYKLHWTLNLIGSLALKIKRTNNNFDLLWKLNSLLLGGALKIILIRESFSVSTKHEIFLRIGKENEGRWGSLGSFKIIGKLFHISPKFSITNKLCFPKALCIVAKIVQKGPFIVRPLVSSQNIFFFSRRRLLRKRPDRKW